MDQGCQGGAHTGMGTATATKQHITVSMGGSVALTCAWPWAPPQHVRATHNPDFDHMVCMCLCVMGVVRLAELV